MITYGHEKYIREAIQGVLLQECNLKVELILANDCSPDGTDHLIQDIIQNHPRSSRIKYFKHPQNMGMMANFEFALKACEGNYIAICEGDDYWTDPYKLQKQIDFLENNPSFSLTFHNAILKNNETENKIIKSLDKKEFSTIDLLKQWFIPTASIVFRNYEDFSLPDWFVNCQSGDIPLLLLLSLKGDFKYIDETMSVYRIHSEGISNIHKGYDKVIGMIYIYQSFNIYSNFKFQERIKESIIFEIQCHLPEIQELKHLRRLRNNILKKTVNRLKNKVKFFFR
jgi:glycosyltransferase involved in cell wall biosynthesis